MTTRQDRRWVLRREVGLFRERESRRRFDPAVHVGVLGGPRDSFTVAARDLPVMDAGLRTDVVTGLLEHAPDDWRDVWVTRPGDPEQHDLDLAWLSAARAAFAAHGRTLATFHALTRTGWRDVVTGETRTWVRLRL
ncbi:MAG: hypothetical protein ACXVWU_09660 [Nocardioides sp.]